MLGRSVFGKVSICRNAKTYGITFAAFTMGLGATFALGVNSAGATSTGAASKVPIPYCLEEPLTGNAASLGLPSEEVATIIINHLNAAGGIDGHKIIFNALDSLGTAQGGAAAANRAVYVDHCPFISGGFASVMLATQQVAAPANVLVFNDGGAGTELLRKPYLYDLSPQPPVLAPAGAKWQLSHGVKSIVEIYSDDAYGEENASVYKGVFTHLGGKVLGMIPFPLGTTDFSAELAQAKSLNPEGYYSVVLGASQGFLDNQVASAGLTGKMWMGPLLSGNYKIAGANENGTATSGFIGVNPYVNPNAKSVVQLAKWWATAYPSTPFSPTLSYLNGYQEVEAFVTLEKEAIANGLSPLRGASLLKELNKHPKIPSVSTNQSITFNLATHGSNEDIAIQNLVGNGTTVRTLKLIKG